MFARLGFHALLRIAVIFVMGGLTVASASAGDRLIVHEWGTFTSLQDERGRELAGINTDDEPVPQFVHNLNPFLLSQPVLSSLHWQYRVTIPADYQRYLDLGRFRNALVAPEESVRPTKSLTTFVNNYQLHPFRIPAARGASARR